MKLLYIALCDLCADGEVGIRSKVYSQLKSLEKRFDTYLISWDNMLIHFYQREKQLDKRVLLSYEDIYTYIEHVIEEQKIEVIFLRYLQTNPWLNKFLKHMRTKNIKVIIEFPTIPYEGELKGRVELKEDLIYRKDLRKYVRYSTNYNGLSEVFGIPSVSLHNGIVIENIPQKENVEHEGIRCIAVASMNPWHGYERMIRGLAEYYSKDPDIKVDFSLVGFGKEIPRYQDLIQEYHLEEHIKIEGIKRGKELDDLFNRSDIAIGSLGMYKYDMPANSAIKTKEYCARGIPVLIGSNDLAFQEDLPFIHKVPGNADNIDIEQVIAFLDHYKKVSDSSKVRAYADTYLTWDKQFEKLYQFAAL